MAPYSPLPPNAKPRPVLNAVRPYHHLFGQTVPPSSNPNTLLNTLSNPTSTTTTYRRPAHERALLERSRWMLSLAVCCMLMVGWMVASPETAHLDHRLLDIDMDMEHSRHIVQPGMFRHIHKFVSRDIPPEPEHENEFLWRSTTTLEITKKSTTSMVTPPSMMTTLSKVLVPKRAQHTTSAVFSDVAQADEPSTENTSSADSQDDQSTATQSSPSPSSPSPSSPSPPSLSSPSSASTPSPSPSGNPDTNMTEGMGESFMPASSSSPAPEGGMVRRGKVDKRRSRTGGLVSGERWVWVEKGVLELD